MWIVSLALRRPYTFIVVALLVFAAGVSSALRTPIDIFPNIDIPVVSVIWSYGGFSSEQMANRITSIHERALTSDVDDIAHIESQSLNGVSVIKIYFHQGADINRAIAQTVSDASSILKLMPPGTLPPSIISYSASTVPILQLGLESSSLSEQQLYDLGNSNVRTQLATIQGAGIPLPYGGKVRQVMIDLNDAALQSTGLTPADVVNAVNAQNLILPGGTAKIGNKEYNVELNGSTSSVAALNDLPIKAINGRVIYVHDVANVRDGYAPQTNIVRSNGKRGAMLTVEKSGTTSTLTIISQIKAMLPKISATLPKSFHIIPLNDQSVFVKAAVTGVAREAIIAACLTAIMILLFLGSWRATLIIAVSIPLAVLASLIALSVLGQTINTMTLGGLALAVGILVDDTTVAIENITHHLENGESLHDAILNGSGEIAVPTFVSTSSICIVFAPMFLFPGVARFLFVPLAEAVIFAMIASYFFSRTLVPTMAMYLLRHEAGKDRGTASGGRRGSAAAACFARLALFQRGFEQRFERFRERYHGRLSAASRHPLRFICIFVTCCLASAAILPFSGYDFFPSVDAGEIMLHMRAPTGTRIEETARLTDEVEAKVRQIVPNKEITSVIDNIGLPVSGINLTYASSSPIGTEDADITISLAANHRPTDIYVRALRTRLAAAFPDLTFAFLPADMTSQILNFGLPAPIDIQIVGTKLTENRAVADTLLQQLRTIPGLVDARIQQPSNEPTISVDVDRTRAILAGLQQRDIAQSLLVALSGSAQTTPNFWLNPANGVSYPLVTMVPQYDVHSMNDLSNIPLSTRLTSAATSMTTGVVAPQLLLGDLGELRHTTQQAVVSHYNVQPVIDIFASVDGTDLGSVAKAVQRKVDGIRPALAQGSSIVVRGQVQAMQSAFKGLLTGLAVALCLVYLLMVVNFQSWTDPAVIVCGLCGSLAGIVWILFVTNTHISVPALTGTILCMGIATANSILVVNTARSLMSEGKAAMDAAVEAGFSRFRPVLMTALAMLIGMLPMALGLGDGGEQNAPLGRAVMGGLFIGTASTLFLVPLLFGVVHSRRKSSGSAGSTSGRAAANPG